MLVSFEFDPMSSDKAVYNVLQKVVAYWRENWHVSPFEEFIARLESEDYEEDPVEPPVVVPPIVVDPVEPEPPIVEPEEPIEDPDTPLPLMPTDYLPLVVQGRIDANYNWSWGNVAWRQVATDSHPAYLVNLPSWAGIKLRQDGMAQEDGVIQLVTVTVATKTDQDLRFLFTEDGEGTEYIRSVIGGKWNTFWFEVGCPAGLTVEITSNPRTEPLELFVAEIALVNEKYSGVYVPDIDFNYDYAAAQAASIVLPAAVPSFSVTSPLHTKDNKIVDLGGIPWQGRGVNLFDTRSCNSCAYNLPNPEEIMRRVDYAVDELGCNFLRLCTESYNIDGGRTHWDTVLNDPQYLADLTTILTHIGTKTEIQVLLSLWIDPSFDARGRPTEQTALTWKYLASAFKDMPHVMFGICNEPEGNYNGANDELVIQRMQMVVNAIREVAPNNIISVQGTGEWARRMSPYITNPIVGTNIIYECHTYNPFQPTQWLPLAQVAPVILGEFGPFRMEEYDLEMTANDIDETIAAANAAGVSWLAWCLHHNCPPNILNGSGTGLEMNLSLTPWGEQVARLIKE